jgi:SpoVK/Ycf46/Vps4 family AAA+-type ATPase
MMRGHDTPSKISPRSWSSSVATVSTGLLRASDFCRPLERLPRSAVHISLMTLLNDEAKRWMEGIEMNHDRDTTNVDPQETHSLRGAASQSMYSERNEESYTSSSPHRSNSRKPLSEPETIPDPIRAVYIPTDSFLWHQVGLYNGSAAWLVKEKAETTHRKSGHCCKVLVRVWRLPLDNEEADDDDDSDNMDEEQPYGSQDNFVKNNNTRIPSIDMETRQKRIPMYSVSTNTNVTMNPSIPLPMIYVNATVAHALSCSDDTKTNMALSLATFQQLQFRTKMAKKSSLRRSVFDIASDSDAFKYYLHACTREDTSPLRHVWVQAWFPTQQLPPLSQQPASSLSKSGNAGSSTSDATNRVLEDQTDSPKRPVSTTTAPSVIQEEKGVTEATRTYSQWKFPPPCSLLQVGTVAVATTSTGTLCLYAILHMVNAQGRVVQTGSVDVHTTFVIAHQSSLDRASSSLPLSLSCPSFPPLPWLHALYNGGNDMNKSLNRRIRKTRCNIHGNIPFWNDDDNVTLPLPPHPNVPVWIQQLSSCLSLTNRPESFVWHTVGSHSVHHTHVAIKTAAHCLGRAYVSVTGLAAYAFRSSANVTGGGGSGSLAEVVAGFQSALQEAHRRSPSVLHIQRLDAEWEHAPDPADVQSRLWACWQHHFQQLASKHSSTAFSSASVGETEYEYSGPLVPSVLLILETSQPLNEGSIRQELQHATIQASLPDAAYLECLWYDQQSRSAVDQNHTSPLTRQELFRHLQNRPIHDVLAIRRDYQQALANYYQDPAVSSSPLPTLAQMCSVMDDRMRRNPSQQQQQNGAAHIPSVQWEDVGGLSHVRHEITNTIELPLQYPHLFAPGTGRSGLLLYGPPGTGKTLVAKAVATECALPFVSIKGPELLGSFVGESEARVRQIFAQARHWAQHHTPPACVLFFDELDSFAPRRGDSASGGGNVMDRVVATLLSEMDASSSVATLSPRGVTNKAYTVFCMGATNRPDLLDPALLRPGRLDRLIYLGVSQKEDRDRILAAQLRKIKLEGADGDVHKVAALVARHLPPLVTGADISTIASSALMKATERLCQKVDDEVARRNEENETQKVTIDELLDEWDDNQLEPAVTLSDLIEAAKNVIPSVSLEDLEKYAKLQEKFQTGKTLDKM